MTRSTKWSNQIICLLSVILILSDWQSASNQRILLAFFSKLYLPTRLELFLTFSVIQQKLKLDLMLPGPICGYKSYSRLYTLIYFKISIILTIQSGDHQFMSFKTFTLSKERRSLTYFTLFGCEY